MANGGQIRVEDEQGNVHVFPAGSTPEMIAKALNVKPPPVQQDIASGTKFIEERTPSGGPVGRYFGGLYESAKSMLPNVAEPFTGEYWKRKYGTAQGLLEAVPGVETAESAWNVISKYLQQRQQGAGRGYATAAAASGLVPGLDEPGIRRRGEAGDVAGIMGEITIPTFTAALMGEQAIRGKTALGTALGKPVEKFRKFVGTKIATEEAAKVRPAGVTRTELAVTPKESLAHAKAEGINLTPFQASEQKLAGAIQKQGEVAAFGGKDLEQAMQAEREKFGAAVNRMADRVDPQRMGLSEEQAGESIQQSAQEAKKITHENASAAYQNLEWTKTTPVDVTPLTKKWMELRGSLPMGAEEQVLSQVPRDMRAMVEEMFSPTGIKAPLSFDQAIQLRSLFRELGEVEGLPDRVQGVFRQMTSAADSAMESSAGKARMDASGRTFDATKEWREANQGWKRYAKAYGDRQSPLYKILSTRDPAQITRQLLGRASAKDVMILKEQGMEGALEALRRQVLGDMTRSGFRVGASGLGGYSDSFLNQLFGRQATKELYLKADIARRMKLDANPSGTAPTLEGLQQFLDPRRLARLAGAAKFSMPRDPLSYLEQPSRLRLPPGSVLVPGEMKDRKELPQ